MSCVKTYVHADHRRLAERGELIGLSGCETGKDWGGCERLKPWKTGTTLMGKENKQLVVLLGHTFRKKRAKATAGTGSQRPCVSFQEFGRSSVNWGRFKVF